MSHNEDAETYLHIHTCILRGFLREMPADRFWKQSSLGCILDYVLYGNNVEHHNEHIQCNKIHVNQVIHSNQVARGNVLMHGN